jgi:hypothetical protein
MFLSRNTTTPDGPSIRTFEFFGQNALYPHISTSGRLGVAVRRHSSSSSSYRYWLPYNVGDNKGFVCEYGTCPYTASDCVSGVWDENACACVGCADGAYRRGDTCGEEYMVRMGNVEGYGIDAPAVGTGWFNRRFFMRGQHWFNSYYRGLSGGEVRICVWVYVCMYVGVGVWVCVCWLCPLSAHSLTTHTHTHT